jgi:hypothetical protein
MMRAMTRLMFAAVIAAVVAGGSAPSQAADLEILKPHVKHLKKVRTVWVGAHWRDRCAFEGYYCLYAEYGAVYHYPWDDRPIAAAYYGRRVHRR